MRDEWDEQDDDFEGDSELDVENEFPEPGCFWIDGADWI